MRRVVYETLLRAPVKVGSGALTAVGAVGTIWPHWVQSKIGGSMTADQIEIVSKVALVAGIIYFALLWLLKPGESAPSAPPPSSQTSSGPSSPNFGTVHGNVTFHAAPAALQPRKSPYGWANETMAGLNRVMRGVGDRQIPSRRPDLPVWKAVQHISVIIGDDDEQHCFPQARREIRQAARDGRIDVWGKRGRDPEHLAAPLGCSDIWTPIEPPYWDDFKLNPLSTGMLYEGREHTDAEPHIRHGLLSGQYWDLRVREEEIERLWPEPLRTTNNGNP